MKHKKDISDELMIEVFRVLRKSRKLKEIVETVYSEIEKTVDEDDKDKGWAEKEARVEKLKELEEQLEKNIDDLLELDKDYQKVCAKINLECGEIVMNPLPPITREDIEPEDDEDEEGEEWKKT